MTTDSSAGALLALPFGCAGGDGATRVLRRRKNQIIEPVTASTPGRG